MFNIAVSSCHVVDDHVRVDTHTDRIAATDHVSELLLIARAGDEAVGDWLVSFPPWPIVMLISNNNVFSRR